MATEDQSNEAEKECLYKTKIVQFLGRTTPIILQNDNGPCPLLAICNVLLLKNNLNLSVDSSEVSLQKLLSLVAERIIDSNSNVENKDAGYAQNQQQNIGDAMDLLPRLSTGIDVNIKFRRIDDFEFTRECTIFDLLDIPLYHGWIVDPQDTDTARAIGSKSYNTLTGELVALETSSTLKEQKSNTEDDLIDFAAATTATLGVPSPCLAKSMSFDDCPLPETCPTGRKGDVEEEVELLRALELSTAECPTTVNDSFTTGANENSSCVTSNETAHPKSSDSGVITDTMEKDLCDEQQIVHQPELSISHDCEVSHESSNGGPPFETISGETNQSCMGTADGGNHSDQSSVKDSGVTETSNSDALVQNQTENFHFSRDNPSSEYTYNGHIYEAEKEVKNTNLHDQSENFQFSGENSSSEYAYNGRGYEGGQEVNMNSVQDACTLDDESACDSVMFAASSGPTDEQASSGGKQQQIGVPESVTSSLDNSEPLYEGEECILDAGQTIYETREPVYEGELVLSEKADKGLEGACTPHEGVLIRSFLRNNASQLTIFGLFCLQEGLKERELCVFFRNNHFSTMFKFNGELYLLATDQGYINQPDLVWEKLNEVNGDTVFMTGNFKEFKLENQGNVTWDEQNAMASTADYLANMDHSNPEASTFNSDLQLAIALQQREYENQQQQQPPNLQQPSSGGGSSGLVVGPQRPKTSSSNPSSKQEAKSKDKCTVM